MKKKVFFLMAVIVMAVTMFAQNPENNQQVRAINKEIGRLQKLIEVRDNEIISLIDYSREIFRTNAEIDSLRAIQTQTVYGLKLKDQAIKDKGQFLNALAKKQSKYKNNLWKFADRDTLRVHLSQYLIVKNVLVAHLETYKNYQVSNKRLTNENVSNRESLKELGCIQSGRLFRGLAYRHADRVENDETRREGLTFEKLRKNPLLGDSLGLVGIISNKYYMPITFKFFPLDGGESKSLLVSSGRIITENLIPGRYLVHYLNGGREICEPQKMTVSSVINSYDGIACHWFVYMPSR